MKICYLQTTSATGETLSEVPMTRSKSTLSLSLSRARSNLPVNFSPKNVISGYNQKSVLSCPKSIRADDPTHLHNPRWRRRFLIALVRLITIPSALLLSFLTLLWWTWRSWLWISLLTDLAVRYRLILDILLDFRPRNLQVAFDTGRRGKWAMTLKDARDSCKCFEGVYILGVIL